MTERQKKFVDEYLVTGNASEAARRAGYSARCANRQGFKLLGNTEIRAEISARKKALADEKIATTQEVLERLTRILRRQEQETVVCANGKIVTIPTPITHTLRAAYLLLKVYGAFRERVEEQSSATDLFVSTLEKIWQEKTAESARGAK